MTPHIYLIIPHVVLDGYQFVCVSEDLIYHFLVGCLGSEVRDVLTQLH